MAKTDTRIRNAVHFHIPPEQRFKEVKELIAEARQEERKRILGEYDELKEVFEYLNSAFIRMKLLMQTQFCFPGPHPAKAIERTREALAEYAHEAWNGWMKYLFNKSSLVQSDGTIIIPAWAVERWARQMGTEYEDLPEQEKKSDREEADRMIKIFKEGNDAS